MIRRIIFVDQGNNKEAHHRSNIQNGNSFHSKQLNCYFTEDEIYPVILTPQLIMQARQQQVR